MVGLPSPRPRVAECTGAIQQLTEAVGIAVAEQLLISARWGGKENEVAGDAPQATDITRHGKQWRTWTRQGHT